MVKNVKRGFLISLLILSGLFFAGVSQTAYCAESQTITFAWDANTEKDLAGYRLYRSTESGKYLFGKDKALLEIPKGTLTAKVINIQPGYFVLTAFDNNNFESGPSNELETFSPKQPAGLTITVVVKIES